MLDSIPFKRCSRCNRNLPATKQYFHSHKKYADGLYYQCKECRNEVSQEWQKQPPIPDGYKKCVICQQILPSTNQYFYKDPRNRICGLRSECKSCIANQTKIKRQQSPNFQYGGTKVCSQCKQTKPATPEHFHINKATKDGLEFSCKACYSMYYRQYSHEHPDIVKARRDRRRANVKNNDGTYTPEQIQDLLRRQKYKCYYCAKKLKKVKSHGKWKYIYHIDHTFPLSRVSGIPANSIDYLVLACPICNWRKSDRFPWEFPEGGRLL